MLLVAIFFVSGADAASIVMGTLSERGTLDPSKWVVVFWGVATGGVAAVMLLVGDEDALTGLQNITIVAALPFVVVMDCLNGFFADPSLLSLSEAFLQAPNGGAVASFASSGLTIPDGQHEMGLRMFQLLYSGASIPIGDASRQAKTATSDRDVRRTWILLGDPTLKIR